MRKLILSISIITNILTLIFAFATNFSTTVILFFCLSVFMTIYGFLLNNSKALKVLKLSFIFTCSIFIIFNIFIYMYGKNDNASYNEDAIVILGAGIRGEKLSLILKERLDVGIKYYNINPNAFIVVSGGQGSGEDITEALAMERYLVDNGIPVESILKEEEATSTCENINFSKALLDKHFNTDYNIAIVTNDFHIFRSVMIAKNIGLESTHLHEKIPIYGVPANYLRETITTIFQILFGC